MKKHHQVAYLLIAAVIGWIIYGSFKGGQAYQSTTSASYEATT